MSYNDAVSLKADLELLGFITITEIKSSKNVPLNKVKLICETEEAQNKFIKTGIKVNFQLFRCEIFKQHAKVTQCFKCQKLGHISSHCNSDKDICPRCGKDSNDTNEHTTDVNNKKICKSEIFCTLCKQNHSAAYANCSVKKDRLNVLRDKLNNRNSYAAAVSNNNNRQRVQNSNNDNF
jgi:hypothetical protein